jgi:hypothetical protein
MDTKSPRRVPALAKLNVSGALKCSFVAMIFKREQI